MISIRDLRLPPQVRESTAREEMRRAALHLEGVVTRTAHALGNCGESGYHLTLIEALAVLRSKSIAAAGEADLLLRQIGPLHSRPASRVTELLEDVVRVSNTLDALREEFERSF